jgi:hypothetical protein
MTIAAYIEKKFEAFKQPYKFEENVLIDRYADIHRIYSYRRDKYVNCDDDKAIFWQLATPTRRNSFKKNILPATKDFYPEGMGKRNQFNALITKLSFRTWARESGFVYDKSDLCEYLTDFGEAVWKITPKEDEKDVACCDLRRIFFDRTVPFDKSDKIEAHEFTVNDLWKKDGIWENVAEVVEHAVNNDENGMGKFKIYEFEGWHNENEYAKPEKMHYFVYKCGDNEKILFEEKLKEEETNYVYFKLNDELWGVFQRMFVLQELCNRRVNQNDEAQQIASLLLLRTANPNVSGNVLQDAVSGQIVPDSTLEQIGIDNRAISAFAQEMMMFEVQADRLCMTPDVITGSDLPSGAPFRSLATLSNKATSAFKDIRTLIAEGINNVLVERIFPTITRQWEDKFLQISDDDNDIKEFDNAVVERLVYKWAMEMKESQGRIPTWEEWQTKKQDIVENLDKEGRQIYVDKGFFNFRFGMTYNHSNEIEDRAQQNDTLNNLLQYKMSNPAISNDPLFRQLAEKNGVSATKLSQEEIQQLQPETANVPNIRPKQDSLMSQVDSNV